MCESKKLAVWVCRYSIYLLQWPAIVGDAAVLLTSNNYLWYIIANIVSLNTRIIEAYYPHKKSSQFVWQTCESYSQPTVINFLLSRQLIKEHGPRNSKRF
jgi:hypothetical protein